MKVSVPAAFMGVILIWSTTPLAIKWSGEGPGFLFGVSARMVLGLLLCMLLMAALRIRLPWHNKARLTYVVAGAGIYGAMTSVYWGAQYIPSGLVSVVFGLTPLVTGAFASLWLAERSFTAAKVTGMLFGMAGLIVIFGASNQSDGHALWGIAAVLLSVLIHSISSVWVKRIGASMPAMATTTGALLFAVPVYLMTWMIFGDGWPQRLPDHALASIVYLGVFGSALGFILYYYALNHVEAGRLALIAFITPVTALLIGMVFNHEVLKLNVAAGAILILSGLLFYEWGGMLSIKILSGYMKKRLL